jgi:hypothetical protein
MIWFADPKKQEARSDKGYVIKWALNTRGSWHNAWTPEPNTRVLAASYDRKEVEAACERHYAVHGQKVVAA